METPSTEAKPWQDETLDLATRVDYLVREMTLEEKLSQLVGLWVGVDASGGDVAPYQSEMNGKVPPWPVVIKDGLGQLTRPFGTAPVDPLQGAKALARAQTQVAAANRFGIPAQVHDECLAGFAAWQATAYPVPLAWGASFSPDLVERMGAEIGRSMLSVGVHQGLAPVLDVTRDYRWGRTEETIGEDPLLVGTVGAAYVKGMESTGAIATLKHFAGYSASRAGRNLAPVPMGRREFADVILPPFEMALRHGGARSVMHSYSDVDGVPAAADEYLLTTLLREQWGFTGTVVADYYGIAFLHTLHAVADSLGSAAGLALAAGVDVELPSIHAFGDPLREAIASGQVPVDVIDRALRRVLLQKGELGLLDADWSADPEAYQSVALDDSERQETAAEIAKRSVVLLANNGVLPLRDDVRLAVVGPLADDPMGMLGCYSFPAHVGVRHPEYEMGIDIASVLTSLADSRGELPYERGCDITGDDRSGIAAAVELARGAEVCVVAVGDRAGLFGRGTSGEGCDVGDLTLPGVQAELVRAVLDTGTPVVLVLLTGRPYAVADLVADSAAVVQAFFPGQRGGQAIADVLTGALNPSGRLPVSMPADSGGQPGTYLAPPLARRTTVSSIDPSPLFGFGHGISYTTFEWSGEEAEGSAAGSTQWAVDGTATVSVTVRNTGERAGAEVVQLYLHDVAAQVVQPVIRLVGFARVELEAGASAQVRFTVPADATSFTGVQGQRIVEPGAVELRLGRSSQDMHAAFGLELVGSVRPVGHDRAWTQAQVDSLDLVGAAE